MRVDRATCAHEFETTDACGLCIVCQACGKKIGAPNHRRHPGVWARNAKKPVVIPKDIQRQVDQALLAAGFRPQKEDQC